MKQLKWRIILITFATLVAILITIPSFSGKLPSGLDRIIPQRSIKLGLDLKGGMHLIFNVDKNKAIESSMDLIAQDLKKKLNEEGITDAKITGGEKINVFLTDPSMQEPFRDVIQSQFPDLEIINSGERDNGYYFDIEFKEIEKKRLLDRAADQALETIRNRIDQFGVAEPLIARQGESEIVVQLPGIKTDAEKEQAKKLIGKTALLEFKLVDDSSDFFSQLKDKLPDGVFLTYEPVQDRSGTQKNVPYLTSASKNKLSDFIKDKVPEGRVILIGETKERETKIKNYRTYLLYKETLLTGSTLVDARAKFDRFPPYVAIKFNSAGADRFYQITREHVGERLAIILDDIVHSAPRIKDVIAGGNAIIEGSFTDEEAKLLAIVLRSGSLPAPLKLIGEISVGPTLGQDSISKGLKASLIGTIAVFLFMIYYYSFSGFIASICLVLNILFIIAIMSVLRATLTLPGIAGIALTIGMAVDANVLIFERIKEELKLGKTPRAAVDAGFSKAFGTIFDSNLTTIVAAIALFLFGSGPVKGFGITLSLGLVANMFTAVFVAKVIYDYLLQNKKVKSLSI
jgi:protein-export membrane protein SecD